jgi:hypothetical protein
MVAKFQAELDSPEMFTLDLTVHMIGTRAIPNAITPALSRYARVTLMPMIVMMTPARME